MLMPSHLGRLEIARVCFNKIGTESSHCVASRKPVPNHYRMFLSRFEKGSAVVNFECCLAEKAL